MGKLQAQSVERGRLLNPRHWVRQMLPTSRRLLLEKSLRQLDLSACKSVLICGAGHDPYRHLFQGAQEYVCLDIEEVPGVTDVVADVLSMPFEDGRFDCVVATECMEHIADPFTLCSQITRVLKPGGRVVLSVPFMFHQHGDPYDFWRPTRHCLESLFKEFDNVEIISHGHRLHVVSDLCSTASPGWLFAPLRLANHLLARLPGSLQRGHRTPSATTGFLLTATKSANSSLHERAA